MFGCSCRAATVGNAPCWQPFGLAPGLGAASRTAGADATGEAALVGAEGEDGGVTLAGAEEEDGGVTLAGAEEEDGGFALAGAGWEPSTMVIPNWRAISRAKFIRTVFSSTTSSFFPCAAKYSISSMQMYFTGAPPAGAYLPWPLKLRIAWIAPSRPTLTSDSVPEMYKRPKRPVDW